MPSFQSFEQEARQYLAAIVSDAETVAGDIQSALNSPVIVPFIAQIEAGLEAVLTAAGLPAGEIGVLSAEILNVLNGVGQKVAKAQVKLAAKKRK